MGLRGSPRLHGLRLGTAAGPGVAVAPSPDDPDPPRGRRPPAVRSVPADRDRLQQRGSLHHVRRGARDGPSPRGRAGRRRSDAVLVNIARGKVVVEDDLFDHLRTHPSFRAALDVWWTYPESKRGRPFRRPFHELPNVLMTPHVANAIPTQRREAMESAIDNVLRFLRGETPRHVVDPEEYA